MPSAGIRQIFRNRALLFVLIAAALLRFGYLWYYSTLPQWDQLTVDNYYHHHWAQDIAQGDILGDTTYFRAPFYVYCLALLYATFGDSLWIARLFGLAIGVVSVLLTFLIARRIFGRPVGLLAAALHALYPVAVYFESELLLDPLFTLLFESAVLTLVIWWDTHRMGIALIAGVMLGLAAITRPTALVYAPFVILAILILTDMVAASRLKHTVLFLAGMAICILPISVRNYVIADDPVLIASQGGINLYIGNNPSADGLSATMPEPLGANWRLSDIIHIAEQDLGRRLKPGEVSGYWNSKARDWVASHPDQAAELYLKKLYYSLSNREISNNRDLSTFFQHVPFLEHNPLSFAIIFAFGLVGATLAFADPRVRILAAAVALMLATNAVFFVNSRFRLPVIPLLIILSAFAVVRLYQMFGNRPKQAVIPLFVFAFAASFSYAPLVPFPRGVNVQGLISEALYYHAEGDYPRTIDLLGRAEQLDPAFPELHLNIGASYFRLGQSDSALYHLQRETKLHPDRPKAYANLASLALINGQTGEARRMLARALEIRPFDVTANLLALRLTNVDSARLESELRTVVRAAVVRSDSDLQVMQEAANLLQSSGFVAEAESLLRASLNLEPPAIETDDAAFDRAFPHSAAQWQRRLARSHYQLGYLLGVTGHYDQSITHSDQAIRLDSTLADAYVNLVSGHLALGRTVDASRTLSVALSRFPRHERLQKMASLLKENRP